MESIKTNYHSSFQSPQAARDVSVMRSHQVSVVCYLNYCSAFNDFVLLTAKHVSF